MPAPTNQQELEKTIAFKEGVNAKNNKVKLADAIRCLHPGSWRYDAFVAGYDSVQSIKVDHKAPSA